MICAGQIHPAIGCVGQPSIELPKQFSSTKGYESTKAPNIHETIPMTFSPVAGVQPQLVHKAFWWHQHAGICVAKVCEEAKE